MEHLDSVSPALWNLAGRGLTALWVLAWAGWAGGAAGGHETGAAVAGWIGLVVVVVATVLRRRELARSA